VSGPSCGDGRVFEPFLHSANICGKFAMCQAQDLMLRQLWDLPVGTVLVDP
jgi:uncharacterized protein (DUF983 family)